MKAIEVKNVSKMYRLGEFSTGSVAHDLNRWMHKVRGKEDPYSKIAQTNKRDEKTNSEYVWSLKDVSFSVEQGDILGIIGKNGAGKSTLLKILSRVTGPTTGSVKMRGRVASLLEVGTGFHPDLTGKENVFLNGAILGMTKKEIRSKFDEIVDFSGVERYIDTPVKRYSSGMYVRLAFAVAAHLEPEILIVDEVLAVGDAEFQKKCLGKMKDVSTNDGRTVLFVSHNLASVRQLCNKGIVLKDGLLDFEGITEKAVDHYLQIYENYDLSASYTKTKIEDKDVEIISAKLINRNKETTSGFDIMDDIIMQISILCKKNVPNLFGYIVVMDEKDNLIIRSDTFDNLPNIMDTLSIGENSFYLKINKNILALGNYKIYLSLEATSFTGSYPVDVAGWVLKLSIYDYSTRLGSNRNTITSILPKWEKIN